MPAAQAATAGANMPLSLPTGSYAHSSPPLSQQRLLNLYAEPQPTGSRAPFALLPTPGLSLVTELGSAGPVYAMNSDLPGRTYAVSGDHAWRIKPLNVTPPEDLGFVGLADPGSSTTPSRMVTIAVGVTATVFCVPPRAYVCGHDLLDMHQIGGDFPGASSVTYLNGRFVFTAYDNTSQFFACEILDPTAYNAFDFAFADGVPNVTRRVVTHRGELWFMGESGPEVWYDAGNADFPYRRMDGGAIDSPVISPRSVARGDGSVFWVDSSCTVLRSEGYRPVRISNQAIERQLYLGTISTAGTFTQEGHVFYFVSTELATHVYDCQTKEWHNRSSNADGSGPWRVMSVGHYGVETWLGDRLTGRIFYPDMSSTMENATVSLLREATMPTLRADGNRVFVHRVEIDTNLDGQTTDVRLRYTDDNGATWSGWRVCQTPVLTNGRSRVPFARLGSFRQGRVFQIRAMGRTALYGVEAQLDAGAGG